MKGESECGSVGHVDRVADLLCSHPDIFDVHMLPAYSLEPEQILEECAGEAIKMVLQNRAMLVGRFALALFVGFVFTFYGLLCSWQSVEAPGKWNETMPVVLLLPIAGLSTFFRKLSSDGHLSALTYRLVLVLGSIAQFLYYYAIIAVIRWAFRKVTRRSQSLSLE